MLKTNERSRTAPVLFAFASLLAIVHPPLSPRAFHQAPANDPGVYSVRAFGATGDGKTIDTAAINKAIDSAAAAGGGTKIIVALAPVLFTAWATVLKIGKPSFVVPPLPGTTPPTTCVPYSRHWSA